MRAGLPAVVALALLAACQAPPPARCPRPLAPFAPWDEAVAPPPAEPPGPVGPADALIGGYQGGLRAPTLPGEGCRLRPTCSAYGREALARWGLAGFVLVIDRVIVREHRAMDPGYLPDCRSAPDHAAPRLLDPVP